MFSCDHLNHPSQNDPGTSQADRVPANLLEGSTPIDGRQISDLLNYFTALSGQINFYRDDLSVSDWAPFFSNSLPFLLSTISGYSPDKVKANLAITAGLFQVNPSPDGLQLLFLQAYYTTIYPVQQWSLGLSGSGLDLEMTLQKLIRDRLVTPLRSFISWMNTAVTCYGIQSPDFGQLLANPSWGLAPDDLAYQTDFSCAVKSRRSQLLALQQTISGLVNDFTNALEGLTGTAADVVNDNLYSLLMGSSGQANTPPHLALLFSFLNQYLHALDDLNGLSQKHLDFFFQEVLNLSPGDAVPDKTFVVFSLQKQIPAFILEEGRLLKAGKDSKQADVVFGLDETVTITQTQVSDIRTVFVNKKKWAGPTYTEGIYMASDATMADGLAKPFKNPANASWPTLGAKQSQYTPPGATAPIDYPMARLGFILSSKVLFLQEGKRKVHIRLCCQWNDVCTDNWDFKGLFPNAADAISASYLVLTQDILGKAAALGVTGPVIQQLKDAYLRDPCHSSLCNKDTIYYVDQALVPIPPCSTWKKDPNRWNDDVLPLTPQQVATNKGAPLPGNEPRPASDSGPTVAGNCPDEILDDACQKEETNFWSTFTHPLSGIASWEITILQQILIPQRVFNVLFSGPKGWVTPEHLDMELVPGTTATDNNFVWHIGARLGVGQDPVSFYDKTVFGEDLHTTDPLVKIQLNDTIKWDLATIAPVLPPSSISCLQQKTITCGQQVSLYEFFRNLVITGKLDSQQTSIHVAVCGVTNLVVQNDDNLLDKNKAFAPFGVKPAIVDFDVYPVTHPDPGNYPNLIGPSFYIGSREIFLKKWDALSININWLGKPSNFDIYYSSYLEAESSVSLESPGYQVNLAMLRDGNWYKEGATAGVTTPTVLTTSQTDNNRLLFDWETSTLGFPSCCPNGFQYSYPVTPSFTGMPQPVFDPVFAPVTQYSAGTRNGFIRMTLEYQDFLHKIYPWVLSNQLINGSGGSTPGTVNIRSFIPGNKTTTGGTPVAPNEPWTPMIQKDMSIDYTATAAIEDISLIHLYPFDGTFETMNLAGQASLFPVFCAAGNLYIGLSGLVPGESLNVLFQLAEATADTEEDPGTLSWQYLAANVWKPLESGFQIIQDDTNGLTTTGIIQFFFPDDISNDNTVLPAGVYWISAVLSDNTAASSQTRAILPQAAQATYISNPGVNDPQRAATALPAGTITKLLIPQAEVAKVSQPFDSFGGSAPENSGNNYHIRVSERLRHKGRAIQKWDYERMVLEQFPKLLRAKCINHCLPLDSHLYQRDFPMSPGSVLLAVLPDTNQLTVSDSTQPTVPLSMLNDIAAFLKPRLSCFVKLVVKNPRYEPIDICVTVVPAEKVSPDTAKAQLKTDIQSFLAPWIDGDTDSFQFGKRLYLSDLIGLVENRTYIASVSLLNMTHAGSALPADPPAYIDPLTPRSILIAGNIEVVVQPTHDKNNKNNPTFWKKRSQK